MIVSVCLPMLGGLDAPAELDRAQERSETAPQPGSADCYGYDACRGTDAGNDLGTSMNLTGDFSFTGEETNTYYGLMNGTGTCNYNTADSCNDVYLLDLPMGYGFSVTVGWNSTGADFGVGLGPADGSMTGSSAGAWGRCYSGGSAGAGYVGASSDGVHDCPGYFYTYGGYTFPQDIQGDPVLIWVFGYNVYTQPVQDYTLNITVWTGDGGLRGDASNPTMLPLLDMPDEPASWTYDVGTFNLAAGQSADLMVTYCDVWCTPETSIEVTKPDGTVDSWNPIPDYFTGWLETYSDAGTYTVEKHDTWGDGGMGLQVGVPLGNFTGLLTVDDYLFEDMASGHVGDTTDGSDIFAVWLPENYAANLTLHWDNSADLDLQLYTDYDPATETLSGRFAYSWFDQPEFIDVGQIGDATMFFAEVLHYSGPSTGYSLEYQTEPGAPPPCFYQDDGNSPGTGNFNGNGEDATEGAYSPDDAPLDVTGLVDSDGNGVFEGMMCTGFDESDWYQITVPAGDGIWVMLEWPEGIDSNFNDTIEIEGDISLSMYMVTSSGYQSFVSSSYGFHPQAVASNGSYSWTNDLGVDSVAYLRLTLNEMTDYYESNYTVTLATYNATEEPWQLSCQNDAGQAPSGGCADAGDSYLDAMNLTTGNQTFEGYGHDGFDTYDFYKLYLPNNYAFEVCVEFPEQNDIDLGLFKLHPVYGYFQSIANSYNDNPECAWAQYDDAGNDVYIRIWSDVGSGDYEVTLTLATPGLAPGDNQDDCGMAGSVPNGDAGDSVYPGAWSGHTFTNESTQADLNPYNADGSVRSYWAGGICTGWVSTMWDNYDYFSIAVPEGHYINIDWDVDPDGEGDSSVYHGVYTYMCQLQHMPCDYWSGNGAYYVGTQYTGYGLDEVSVNSGLFPVGLLHNASGCDSSTPLPTCAINNWTPANAVADTPGWIYVGIYTNGDDQDYEMNITFLPLSDLEGGDQNDANSGRDAGTGFTSKVMATDHMNQTQMDTLANESRLEFNGWNHGGLDTTDVIYWAVPANHGMEIEWTCDAGTNFNESCDSYHFFYSWDSSGNDAYMGAAIMGDTMSFVYNTTNFVSTSDSIFGIGIYNWYGYDDDGEGYAVNVTFYTLDADGDGWLDNDELTCGTDPYDANSTPNDTDGDGICDAIDPDIDGDGVGNDLDGNDFDAGVGDNDTDGDGTPDELDADIDGDGWLNIEELICLGAMSYADLFANVTPTDYDGDGQCDIVEASDVEHASAATWLDTDGDNDGVDDETDDFDFDECATTDTDKDGMPDSINTGLLSNWTNTSQPGGTLVCVDSDGNVQTPTGLVADEDDDDDGYLDTYEVDCGSDPLEVADMPIDSTLDMTLGGYSTGECDALDPDDDNDGVNDTEDLWPFDSSEWSDADGDGQGDNRDMDDDNDGWWDSCEASDWLAAQNSSVVENLNYFANNDLGIASNCPGQTDHFPLDGTEWMDTDGDGVGDNTDVNDDGDLDAMGDPWTDEEELSCGSDPLDSTSLPDDFDGDGVCDILDNDDDGDGVDDSLDAFPYDVTETIAPVITGSNEDCLGLGIEQCLDDDGDGWTDEEEVDCQTEPDNTMDVPSDNDGDGLCDLNDADDDDDGVIDVDDKFPYNPSEFEDSDLDGIGDNSDNDDDGDGWLDATEIACANAGGSGDKDAASNMPEDLDGDGTCDAIDADDDNDGHPDPACVNEQYLGTPSQVLYAECAEGDEDRFPRDSTEWFDANEDGNGDNANPVSLIDDVMFDPLPFVGIAVAIGAAGYGLLQLNRSAGQGSEEDAEDYTEEFEDFEFEEDEDPSDDEEDGEED